VEGKDEDTDKDDEEGMRMRWEMRRARMMRLGVRMMTGMRISRR
jgi:hypothetical protein